MATIQSNIRMRDGAGNSAESLVETFNTMHNLIIQSGMVQVSDSDFLGQAKTFSTASGNGLTQVVKNTTSGTETKVGYKVYKHPTLSLYFRIWFVDFNQSQQANSSFARFKYQLSTALDGIGGFVPAKTSKEFFTNEVYTTTSTSSSLTINLSYYPATYEKVTVSCGNDHFWIGRDGGIDTDQGSVSYYKLPYKIDINSFGIFASAQDPTVFCLVYAQETGTTLSGSKPVGTTTTTESMSACLRYMLCNNGAWSLLDNGAAGQLDHPRVTNTVDGVRVAQAKLVVNGIFHRFNFGFTPHRALNSFAVVEINMTGISSQYQALPYLGYANHSPPYNDQLNMSSLIFPHVS